MQLNANRRERDVFIMQPLVLPVQEHLMELLLMLDAARDASATAPTAAKTSASKAVPTTRTEVLHTTANHLWLSADHE